MKKTLLTVLILALLTTSHAQNRAILFEEHFNSTSLPYGWTIDGVAQDRWMISETNNAGDAANELLFRDNSSKTTVARIIMPSVDLSEVNHLFFSFKHYLANNGEPKTIGLATSSDGGHTWRQVWNGEYGESGGHFECFEVNTPDLGQPEVNFSLCIYFDRNTHAFNDWYFDDFRLFTMQTMDLGIQALNVADVVQVGSLEVGMEVFNFGIMPILSVEATYEIEGEWPVTETFDVEIPSMGRQVLTFSQSKRLVPGSYRLSVNINRVNGMTDEDNSNNNCEKRLVVALGTAEKFPMLEHFASSTCAGCLPFSELMNELCENNAGRYTYTAYQMPGPAPGDPYFTEDGRTRALYYDLQFVPRCYPDGDFHYIGAIQQSVFEQLANKLAFVDIRGSFAVDGNRITVKADVMPYIDIDTKIHIAVNEKETFDNASTSGETSFHHVMMKMLPDGDGTFFHFKAGECQHLEFDCDMSPTHVEEMDDLEVAIWVQHHEMIVKSIHALAEKEILNSRFAYEYTDEHPYPVENLVLIEPAVCSDTEFLTAEWGAPSLGNPIGYNVFVNGELAAENITEQSYDFPVEWGMYYVVEVQAVYSEGKTSVKQAATMHYLTLLNETLVEDGLLFPNPATTTIHINGLKVSEMQIFNTLGQLLKTIQGTNEISVVGLPKGMYLLQITDIDGKVYPNKITIQ